MTDEDLIAQHLVTKGATICPPAGGFADPPVRPMFGRATDPKLYKASTKRGRQRAALAYVPKPPRARENP